MRYALTGTDLEVDLSQGNIEEEETDRKLVEAFLGGKGANAKRL